MPEPRRGYLISLCQQAAALDYGLKIETNHPDGLRGDLYYKLKCAGLTTEDLGIVIATPSTPNTLYLLRRTEELPE